MTVKKKGSLARKNALRTAGASERRKAPKPRFPFGYRHPCISGRWNVVLGQWHGYRAILFCDPETKSHCGQICLQVGCRVFDSAKAARAHWKGGVSKVNGRPRPDAGNLINLAAGIAKLNGWKW